MTFFDFRGFSGKINAFDKTVVASILAVKALIFAFGIASVQVMQDRWVSGLDGWKEVWCRWDAAHYLKLAEHGYQAAGEDRLLLVFFPLFPWLTRLGAFLTSHFFFSSVLVSCVSSIAAGLLLLRLIQLDFSKEIALGSVWFLFIFPTSYFLHIGYSESLFLALAIGSFYAARKERWFWAGMLGALACLTRINGLLLFPALATEVFLKYRANPRLQTKWLWIALVPAGLLGYLILNFYVAGDAFQFLVYQRENWHKAWAPPWVGVNGILSSFARDPAEAQMLGMQELLFILLALAATIWSGLKYRAAYTVWAAGNLLLVASTSFVLSVPRYALAIFPIYIMFAHAAQKTIWRNLIMVWSILFLGLFIALYVQGRWAF